MANPRKGTNQFVRQGHTEACYGTSPNTKAKGQAANPPKEINT